MIGLGWLRYYRVLALIMAVGAGLMFGTGENGTDFLLGVTFTFIALVLWVFSWWLYYYRFDNE